VRYGRVAEPLDYIGGWLSGRALLQISKISGLQIGDRPSSVCHAAGHRHRGPEIAYQNAAHEKKGEAALTSAGDAGERAMQGRPQSHLTDAQSCYRLHFAFAVRDARRPHGCHLSRRLLCAQGFSESRDPCSCDAPARLDKSLQTSWTLVSHISHLCRVFIALAFFV
jgi:hypothetical protein